MTNNFIPFALPCIGEEEINSVVKTMRSGWLTTGPKTREFEEAFAKSVGANYALAVNSATAGLHLALEAAGVGLDDFVLTPVWTFTATAEVSRYLGAHPVFVDVERDSLNIDVALLEKRIIEIQKSHPNKLKAIIPVHFAGQACNISRIVELAKKYNLIIIEDAAHSLPSTVKSIAVDNQDLKERTIGNVGHITVFSFYATKTVVTGEGGMVTTNDEVVANRIKLMRLHGINRDVWNRYNSEKPAWYYEIVEPGYKYNLTDIASAIGLEQLAKANNLQKIRQSIAERYSQAFYDNDLIEIPKVSEGNLTHAWHLYVVKLNLNKLRINREDFIRRMAEEGVGCSVHFIPLHLQPYWKNKYQLKTSDFPVASKEYDRVVSLPIYPSMNDIQVDSVITAMKAILIENSI